MNMVSCIDVANLFLRWGNEEGDLITNLKMQKLLYYAQAWHLVFFKKPLFKEDVEAWELGPVLSAAYQEFKKFKFNPIKYKSDNKELKLFTDKQLEFLSSCYETFIRFSAHDLVNMTHNEQPWKDAYENGKEIIPHESMKRFYTELKKKEKKDTSG